MHSFTKGLLGAVLTLSLLVPSLSHAASLTSDQINSVIGLLQSFGVEAKTITAVQMVLTNSSGRGSWTTSSSTTATSSTATMPPGQAAKQACIALSRNLGIGSRGDDVKSLQELLGKESDGDFRVTPTGFFGPLTAKALARFQMNNGIASTTTGTVGPLTRGFLERRCGKGLDHENKGRNGQAEVQAIVGTISTANGSTITVQNAQHLSLSVTVTASTTITVFASTSTPPTAGSLSDLVVGKSIAVKGFRTGNAALTATDIKVGIIPQQVKSLDQKEDDED